MAADQTDEAYRHCQAIARSHYENFPVASLALPRHLRRPVAVVYAFARMGDDLADEGDAPPEKRLQALNAMQAKLDRVRAGEAEEDPVFRALADTVARHGLPWELFDHLLIAFRMDVTKKRYNDFGELMQYCRYSANPVGRLLLHLFGAATPRNLAYSDVVCSALQLINFLQDVGQDYDENGRIYLPQDEMQRFKVSEEQLVRRQQDVWLRSLLDFQIQRARQLLLSGAPLGKTLKGRDGLEVRMIVAGGMKILDKLHAAREQAFSRPRLTNGDRLWILWKAVRAK